MLRPFFSTSIAELEKLLQSRARDAAFIEALLEELENRTTERAAKLKVQARQAFGALAETAAAPSKPPQDAARAPDVPPSPTPASPVRLGDMPLIRNGPGDILTAWTALEVLSPPSFSRPEALAGGDRRAIAQLDDLLPWEGAGERSIPNRRLFYQVVLGTIDLATAVDQLTAVFADTRVERPASRGHAILAALIVDREGRPVEDDAVTISSFGWGVPVALQGRVSDLATWPDVEARLTEELTKLVSKPDKDGKLAPLDRAAIGAAYAWLVKTLDLSPSLVRPPSFAVRSYTYFKSTEPPDALLLNSFYLQDLRRAADLFAQGKAPDALQRYLGQKRPPSRADLLNDRTALARSVRPGRFPLARWPGNGRQPLVLLQQAAVNLAFGELKDGGILAVNGPPGTGKTTLLRDLLAAVVTERAQAMRTFADPAAAFSHKGEKIKAGAGWLHLYGLDDRLKGFELLVASSNNKAVENVSAELPGASAIAADLGDLGYFKSLSDKLLERDTWGLGAAVLGNSGNRHRFRQTFWWDKDVGLATYLAHASGTPQTFTDEGERGGAARRPRIIDESAAPRDHAEALRNWRAACAQFDAALARSQTLLAGLELARVQQDHIPPLSHALDAWEHSTLNRPGFWQRLLGLPPYRTWKQESGAHKQVVSDCLRESLAAGAIEKELSQRLGAATASEVPRQPTFKEAREEVSRLCWAVSRRRMEIGDRFIDDAFFDGEHAGKHRAAPWVDADGHRVRDDLFVAGLKLHKAFIDAAAKPLRHNIGALMNVMGGGSLGSAAKDALVPDLWSSLFLVVPVLSTTFASVDRMIGALPANSLGWLLVDEAGQAVPQAAVGAVMRAKRAVIVGDPVQIPPVVTLPETLTSAIHRRLGVDPDIYDAPAASTQTLADSATAYFAEFAGRNGSRSVGVPLLVHRRCAEPMFGVSNAIAYEGLMVQAKASTPSALERLLGPSRWIDVQGEADDKWCPAEGQVVLDLLRRIVHAGVALDLYVVTPFVVVSENLRRLIEQSGVLGAAVKDHREWVRERVGTVHTVQGREAEAVIFVLGAPRPDQRGARAWAGGQPNLLNVAVTRAKAVLYVVGSRDRWSEAGVFKELAARVPDKPDPPNKTS